MPGAKRIRRIDSLLATPMPFTFVGPVLWAVGSNAERCGLSDSYCSL